MSNEDRLERAMRDHASTVTPAPDWNDVEQRAEALRRKRLRRRAGFTTLGLAAAAVLVVALISVVGDDDSTTLDIATPSTTSTTSTTTSTTTTIAPATTVPVPVRPATAIFPSEGERQFQSPGAAAVAFAREFLGMPNPVVESTALSARVVEVRARPDRPPITSITVADSAGAWFVTGARTKNIDLVTPEAGDRISSPAGISGSSTAFEAHVNWEVREEGQASGEKLGEGFFLGGSNGQFGVFTAQMTFTSPTKSAGTIVLFTRSAEDGAVQEATVIRVTFG
jgi:hypothetical protein